MQTLQVYIYVIATHIKEKDCLHPRKFLSPSCDFPPPRITIILISYTKYYLFACL